MAGFSIGTAGNVFNRRPRAVDTISVSTGSIEEFVYRFWIENEIWFRRTSPDTEPALTVEQVRYAEHYLDG